LKKPKAYLRPVLDKYLKDDPDLHDYQCVNLAVDQMSTFDFIKRTSKNGWAGYEHARKQLFENSSEDASYYVAQDNCIYSIENLKRLKNVKYIVVSIGGNDVYLSAKIQRKLYKSLMPFKGHLANEVALEFGGRVAEILRALKDAVPDAVIIPVIVYHPHYKFSISGVESWFALSAQKFFLSKLVSPMSQQFLSLAQHYALPVIDLSRTFNPNDETHYGTEAIDEKGLASWSGAEPSNVSQHFIAQLVLHVIKHVRPDRDGSVVVYGNTQGSSMRSVCEDRNQGSYPFWYHFGQRSLFHYLFYRKHTTRNNIIKSSL